MERNKDITLLTCHVIGHPPAVITWSKVHGELEQARTVSKDGQLSITNAQKKDSGLYKCKATNILGYDSAVTHLSVVELPQFTVRPPGQLKEFTNHDIAVTCKATGDPKPTITWMKENGELPLGRSKVSVDGTLQIWNAKEEDSGIYTCMAASAAVFKTFSVMKLSVTTKGSIFPSFTNVFLDLFILVFPPRIINMSRIQGYICQIKMLRPLVIHYLPMQSKKSDNTPSGFMLQKSYPPASLTNH